ncbi:MucR family transcriptional regulator [Sphingomonas oryzagri]|uniref:MucR family transcriptional regulator n=1 Tax=Sphingomonas oryzagri TaxID=3042314 RepID=A0ABT6N6S5_9SPHN|nr:MucR family transcriptional regulator [Sphingomonas oryzagri]MDH7640807.1 MucR family transcriptional regulator [Sphingomonas oryzagri]
MSDELNNELLSLTADIVAAHVANNNVATSEVPSLIAQVHAALTGLTEPKKAEEPELQPAVPVRSSVKHDYIVCLEDGKKLKMLKRYLRTNYNMTPEEYRTKWKLPRDYPMVAPAYAEQRRGLAKQIGLGRKKDEAPAKPARAKAAPKAAAATPAKRGRKPKAATPAEA